MPDKNTIIEEVNKLVPEVRAISDKIFNWAELGSQEVKSSTLLMKTLSDAGFKVTGDLKAPEDLIPGGVATTAFRAELDGASDGPTVVIMIEYDALPIGHACGHNLITASGLVAALALARHMDSLPGKLVSWARPMKKAVPRGPAR